jgi:hypothetical protein
MSKYFYDNNDQPADWRKTMYSKASENPLDGRSKKLNLATAEEIRKAYALGCSVPALADKYGVAKSTISDILNNKNYCVEKKNNWSTWRAVNKRLADKKNNCGVKKTKDSLFLHKLENTGSGLQYHFIATKAEAKRLHSQLISNKAEAYDPMRTLVEHGGNKCLLSVVDEEKTYNESERYSVAKAINKKNGCAIEPVISVRFWESRADQRTSRRL